MIYIGTSGYYYQDWKGKFYPQKLPKKRYLDYYSIYFNALEVNFSYYKLPEPDAFNRMADITCDRLLYSVKANREMTHKYKDNLPAFSAFRKALQPLIESELLGCVLLQFPWRFKLSREHWDYLDLVPKLLPEIPLVVEFRHNSWLREDVYQWMTENEIGWCCVDEPQLDKLLPQNVILTSSTSYLRFHGRNYEKWWKHKAAWERYDYLYTETELREWVPKIQQMERNSEKCFVFGNNHYNASAPKNMATLIKLLGLQPLFVKNEYLAKSKPKAGDEGGLITLLFPESE